jgi:hypothetical protein
MKHASHRGFCPLGAAVGAAVTILAHAAPAHAQFFVHDHVWSGGPNTVCWGPGCWTFNGEMLPDKTFPNGVKTGGRFPNHDSDWVRQPVPPNDWHWWVKLPSGKILWFWFEWGIIVDPEILVEVFEPVDPNLNELSFNVHVDEDFYEIILGPDMNGQVIWQGSWSGYPGNLPPDWIYADSSRTSAEPCLADCNKDGVLNILDFLCFQGAFQKGCD